MAAASAADPQGFRTLPWRPLNTITTKKLQAHGNGGERGRGGGRPDGGVGGVGGEGGVGWCGWPGRSGHALEAIKYNYHKEITSTWEWRREREGGGRPDGGVGGEGGVGWCGWRGAAGMHWRPLNTITTKKLQAHGSEER